MCKVAGHKNEASANKKNTDLQNMLNNIKTKLTNHKTLVSNFSYLSILQVITLLIPLITLPYLVKVLGLKLYGLLAFAQAIISYFYTLVNFGFNLIATKEVSNHRNSATRLSEIVSSVLTIKVALFLFSFLILIVVVKFLPQAEGYELVFYLTMYMCLYTCMMPVWYFQGIEQMKYITMADVISKIVSLSLIFGWINTEQDYLKVPIIYLLSYSLAIAFGLWIVFVKHKIKFKWQKLTVLKYYLSEALPIFLSEVSITIYVSSNRTIVGLFLGLEEVSYYNIAERLITVAKSPQSVINQTIFPKISKEKNIDFICKMRRWSLILSFSILIVILVGADYLIYIFEYFTDKSLSPATNVVRLLVLVLPLVAVSNYYGQHMLIPFGYKKDFMRAIILGGVVFLLLFILFYYCLFLDLYTISLLNVLTEVFITGYMFLMVKKYRLI